MIKIAYTQMEKPLSKEIYTQKDIDKLRGIGIQGIEVPAYITSKKELEETIKLLEILKHQMLIS